MSSFKNLRIVDNFYQTSAFFPMPTLLISTLDEEGNTTMGAYSLCFPYYIAGKDYYAMILECRNSSNTAQNILRTGKCAINFLEDGTRDFASIVRLGFPGETSKEKMAKCKFELEPGQAEGTRPLVVSKAFQVFECTWDDTLEDACRMCVKIPRVFLKAALTQMVDYAREQGWTLIDVPQMKEIRDKRNVEKKSKK